MSTPIVTTLYVTRHGLSEHNLHTHVYMGRSPQARLLPEGRAQAVRLGQRLVRMHGPQRPIHRIVCSSLTRTLETGEAIAGILDVDDVAAEDAFWELSKGTWEGQMPRNDLPADVQRALDMDPFGYRYPEGESYRDVAGRVGPAFDRWVSDNPGRTLLFVLHGDVIRALMYHVMRFASEKIGDWVTDPCALTEFRYAEGRYELVRFNDSSHLAD